MITLEELRSIPHIYKQIQKKREQLLFLQEKATAVPSPQGREGDRVQVSPCNNANKYSDEAADLNKEIIDDEIELIALQREAEIFIRTVEDRWAKKILRMRYIKCYTWDEIAELTIYDARSLQRIEYEATYILRH